MTDPQSDLLAEAGLIADDILHGGHDPRFVSPQIRNLAVAYQSLAARVRELEGEVEAAKELVVSLKSVDYQRDAQRARATLDGPGTQAFALMLAELFYSQDAKNYLELQFTDPRDGERFIVTAQRVNGQTPDDLRRAAESDLAVLRADKERLREVAELMRQQISCEHLHHNKRDRHDHTQPCPVIARIDAALAPLAAGEAEG